MQAADGLRKRSSISFGPAKKPCVAEQRGARLLCLWRVRGNWKALRLWTTRANCNSYGNRGEEPGYCLMAPANSRHHFTSHQEKNPDFVAAKGIRTQVIADGFG